MEKEQSLRGGVTPPAFHEAEYISSIVYMAFDRINQNLPKEDERTYEQKIDRLIQGYLLLPDTSANHEFRRHCLIQIERSIQSMPDRALHDELFSNMLETLTQRVLYWLPHLRGDLNEKYLPVPHLTLVK